MTVKEGLKIAENLNFSIPDGYSINYKAKMVETESGGILFDTQLIKGENKIGIILTPAKKFSCNIETKKIGMKTVCIGNGNPTKIINWVEGRIYYSVVTGSPSVSLVKHLFDMVSPSETNSCQTTKSSTPFVRPIGEIEFGVGSAVV